MRDTKNCAGCRNDFYNGHNDMNVKRCWSVDGAKMVRRFRIHRDQLPGKPRAFTQVRVPNCYYSPPWCYYEALPDFVKSQDVVKEMPF